MAKFTKKKTINKAYISDSGGELYIQEYDKKGEIVFECSIADFLSDFIGIDGVNLTVSIDRDLS